MNDDLATAVKFTIKAAGKPEKESEASAEIPEEANLKSMTESSLVSFGRAVKKTNFSGFYEEVASVWQFHRIQRPRDSPLFKSSDRLLVFGHPFTYGEW